MAKNTSNSQLKLGFRVADPERYLLFSSDPEFFRHNLDPLLQKVREEFKILFR